MQIYGYPGDRVDFVSKSGSAGSLVFGDPRSLAEEFFGQPHTAESTAAGDVITYFSGSIELRFGDGSLTEVSIYPQRSKRERVDVFLAKTRLSGLDQEALEQAIAAAGDGVEVSYDEGLAQAVFR